MARPRKNETSDNYTVVVDKARVRKKMHPLGIIVKELKQGDTLGVLEIKDEWAKTKEGYILASQIRKSSKTAPSKIEE